MCIFDYQQRDPKKLFKQFIHGSIPVGLGIDILNLLKMNQDKVIIDAYAGAGIFGLTSSIMGNNTILFEINRETYSIIEKNKHHIKNNLRSNYWKEPMIFNCDFKFATLKLRENSANLIFMHPPYWNVVNYSSNELLNNKDLKILNLSMITTYKGFLKEMEEHLKIAKKLLKPGGFLILLIGEQPTASGSLIPIDTDLLHIAMKLSFTVTNICLKITRNAKTSNQKERIEFINKVNVPKLIHDTLFILQKPLVNKSQLMKTIMIHSKIMSFKLYPNEIPSILVLTHKEIQALKRVQSPKRVKHGFLMRLLNFSISSLNNYITDDRIYMLIDLSRWVLKYHKYVENSWSYIFKFPIIIKHELKSEYELSQEWLIVLKRKN